MDYGGIMSKAVFSDIDGTLTYGTRPLSERTVNDINELIKKRMHFVAVSGRACHCAAPLFKAHGLNIPIIGCSGALCQKADGGFLWEEGFSLCEAKEVIKFTRRQFSGIVPAIYTRENWYVEDRSHPWIRREEEVVRFNASEFQFSSLSDGIIINKVLLIMEDKIQSELLNLLIEAFPYLRFTTTAPCFIEVMPKHVDKGFAVKKYLEAYQIDEKNAYCFGDHMNDLEMLTAVQNSYVVANASDEVKRIANFVCDSCDDDGVAKVIEEKLLK